jgi:hypothetical protein
MVFRAKRDPESSPAIGGIQTILDSRFRGNDGTSDFCKSLRDFKKYGMSVSGLEL